MKVTIMRGLPGAGKSRWMNREAIECKTSFASVSADRFHYIEQPPRADGTLVPPVYEFKQENARAAHNQCLLDFIQAVKEGWKIIVVDNTNISAWEIAVYYRLAEVYGCEVEIVYLKCSPETSLARNVHGVPAATIASMFARLMNETLPPWWNMRTIEAEELK